MKDTKGLKLLVVDDEQDLRETIAFRFEMCGCEVTQAGSGNEAFQKVQKQDFDAVVTDIRMQDGTGIDLLDNIRTSMDKMPMLLLVSGYSDITSEEAYDKGACGILSKPFESKILIETVRKLLLSRDERWRSPSSLKSDTQFKKEFESSENSKDFLLGRGGFFVKWDGGLPKVGSQVDFDLTFKEGLLKVVKGQGVVRWRRSSEKNGLNAGCGIEVIYLADACRNDVISSAKDKNLKSYIPRGSVANG